MLLWLSSYPFSGVSLVKDVLEVFFDLEVSVEGGCTGDFQAKDEVDIACNGLVRGDRWEQAYNRAQCDDALKPVITFGKKIDSHKAIYILCDPRSLVAPHIEYGKDLYKDQNDAIGFLIGDPPLPGWKDHIADWQPWSRENTLLLKVEDLISTPAKVIQEIGDFVGKPPSTFNETVFRELPSYSFYTEYVSGKKKVVGDDGLRLIEVLCAAELQRFSYEGTRDEGSDAVLSVLRRMVHEKKATALSVQQAKLDLQRLSIENDKLSARLLELEHAVEPRLLSIAKLRPLRYALNERNRRKSGGASELEQGLADVGSNEHAEVRAKAKSADDVMSLVDESMACADVKLQKCAAENVGIAVFTHDRAFNVVSVLRALDLQDALPMTHVWIDGDHGNPTKRARVDLVEDCVSRFDVKRVHRNRGNFGFRKMMLLAMRSMLERYEKIIFLEDDCFPTQGAVDGFDAALDEIEHRPDVFSVYGHPFLVPGEDEGLFRFQGWGWATTSQKMRTLWAPLLECYLKTEEEYLAFVDEHFSPDIEALIDVTPGRQPSDTIRNFFAWDETLCLLTAVRGMKHLRTPRRLIYNFGAGAGAAHFHQIEQYRQPPYNMISADELWTHY